MMREDQCCGPPLGAANWCAKFLSTTRTDRTLLWSVRSGIGRRWWRFIERLALPGLIDHWMRRKHEVDRLARAAAELEFNQIVVFGAGLDTLAWRLASEGVYQNVLCTDHPATYGVVRASGATAPNLASLHLDLAIDGAVDALITAPTFDKGAATVLVLEGVLMYLAPPAVERLLRSLTKLPSPRLRLIASWMRERPRGRIGFENQSRFVAPWLSRRGEPMQWATTSDALSNFLGDLGWRCEDLIDLSRPDSSGQTACLGLSDEQLVLANRS